MIEDLVKDFFELQGLDGVTAGTQPLNKSGVNIYSQGESNRPPILNSTIHVIVTDKTRSGLAARVAAVNAIIYELMTECRLEGATNSVYDTDKKTGNYVRSVELVKVEAPTPATADTLRGDGLLGEEVEFGIYYKENPIT